MEWEREPGRFPASAPPERESPKRQTEAIPEVNSLMSESVLLALMQKKSKLPVLKTTSEPLDTLSDGTDDSGSRASSTGESTPSSHSNPDLAPTEGAGGAEPAEPSLAFQQELVEAEDSQYKAEAAAEIEEGAL